MVKTNKAQRAALRRIWERSQSGHPNYRSFRKRVLPTIGCDNAIVVPWLDMWLVIETDGYTHS